MEAHPPSYEDATHKDHVRLIAPYLWSHDLSSACLVCRSWHRIFAGQLWGIPSSHFLYEEDGPTNSLRRFRRSLVHTRLFVRELTHTIRLPAYSGDLYNGQNTKWLYRMLEQLPRLQSLIVTGVSYFDHDSLLALSEAETSGRALRQSHLFAAHLRLFDASNCANATSKGLKVALESFPSLMYLDLSGTIGARDAIVLQTVKSLRSLKVLKLRRLRLSDDLLSSLASAVGTRLRSLDIRENALTETAVSVLQQTCLLKLQGQIPSLDAGRPGNGEPPPSYQIQEPLSARDFENIDEGLYKTLTSNSVNRLALEDSPDAGLTHLRMSTTSLMVEVILSILECGQLLCVDIDIDSVAPPISTELRLQASPSLTYLRIHYSFFIVLSENRSLFASEDFWKSKASVKDDIAPSSSSREELLSWVFERRQEQKERSMRDPTVISNLFPKLRTLAITAIPKSATDLRAARIVISIIRNCAKDASLARLQAQLNYSLALDNHDVRGKAKRYAKSLFPLDTIILELSLTDHSMSKVKNSSAKGWNYLPATKSVTEDRDSETLWHAATTDFSFFDADDNEEDDEEESKHRGVATASAKNIPVYDIVAEISSFRSRSRREHQDALKAGRSPFILGSYWSGEVKLVRNFTDERGA